MFFKDGVHLFLSDSLILGKYVPFDLECLDSESEDIKERFLPAWLTWSEESFN